MHTVWLFLNWPNGTAWSNVVAMPVCAAFAGLGAFFGRNWIGRKLRPWVHRHLGHRAELEALRARLDDHADTLSLDTPGGLAAVMAEARRAASASEAALAEVRALAGIARAGAAAPEKAPDPPPMPAGGPGTSGRKARVSGMGARVAPKQGGATEMKRAAGAKADGAPGERS